MFFFFCFFFYTKDHLKIVFNVATVLERAEIRGPGCGQRGAEPNGLRQLNFTHFFYLSWIISFKENKFNFQRLESEYKNEREKIWEIIIIRNIFNNEIKKKGKKTGLIISWISIDMKMNWIWYGRWESKSCFCFFKENIILEYKLYYHYKTIIKNTTCMSKFAVFYIVYIWPQKQPKSQMTSLTIIKKT